MGRAVTIGLDIAKSVFQLHGVGEDGSVVLRKRLRRTELLAFFAKLPSCLIGIEACGSAHHWARELTRLGHTVRLMAPIYVKPYLKRGKNDAVDAEAICEAVVRPTMRFVTVKTEEQQAVLTLHRARALLVRQRTMLVNALRAHLSEFGIITAQGIDRMAELVARVLGPEADENAIPSLVRSVVGAYNAQLDALQAQIDSLEEKIKAWHRTNDDSRRLASIPGVGMITATALAATIQNAAEFSSGRAMAAWLGLTPRQSSSGNKERLGRITKAGNSYLRSLLVLGATAILRSAKMNCPGPLFEWVRKLLTKKPARLVSVALANKLARVAWAVLMKKSAYRSGALVSAVSVG
jgi:transposase